MTVFKIVFQYHLNDNTVFKAILMGKFSARRVVLTITNLFSELAYVHTYREQCFSRWHEKLPDEVWTATVLNWNKSFTHIEHHAGAVGLACVAGGIV